MLSALQHYVAENYNSLDLYSDELAFGYNIQVHPSTGHFSLDLALVTASGAIALQLFASLKGKIPRETKVSFPTEQLQLLSHVIYPLLKAREGYTQWEDARIDGKKMREPGIFV